MPLHILETWLSSVSHLSWRIYKVCLNNTEEGKKYFWQWSGFFLCFCFLLFFFFFFVPQCVAFPPPSFFFGCGVAEGTMTEFLKNIIQDGNSYQMLQKLDKPLKHCFAGVQPNSSDIPQLKCDQHKALILPSRKLLKIHGPLKCLAENKCSPSVFSFMYLIECIFVLGSIAWDTNSKCLDILFLF